MVLQISGERDDRRILWGLKFSFVGFFWGRKILASIFLVAWFIAKFVVSRYAFANFEWVFPFRQSFDWSGVNANHNAKHSPSLACKHKTENDSRLLKNSEGITMMSGLFVEGKRQEWEWSEKFSKNTSRLLPETEWSQATNLETQKQLNKVDQNAPITSKDMFPKRSAKKKPEKPKIPVKFAKRAARNKEFGYKPYRQSSDFFGHSKLMFLFFVLYHFMLPGNFYYGSEIRHGIFLGKNFGPATFWGFVWSPGEFFGFWFLPPFDHPCHLKSGVPLWAWVKLKRTLNFSHFPSQVNLYSLIRNCVGESNEKTKPS